LELDGDKWLHSGPDCFTDWMRLRAGQRAMKNRIIGAPPGNRTLIPPSFSP
jgi:hypothetical protein